MSDDPEPAAAEDDPEPPAAEPTDEDEEAQSSEEQTETDEAGISESDFVRVDFTARAVESDQLVDTTDPEVAEEEGVDTEEQTIEPRVVPIGAGHLFPSVEEDFVGKEVGDTGSVVVSATEAFGEYDPEDVRTVSADTIPEDDRYPGARVDVDGEQGYVERIIGGRARVDFNHPLVGEDIEYDYEILAVIDEPVEQAKGMIEGLVGVDLEMWIQTDEVEEEVESEGEDLEEEVEPEEEDADQTEDDTAPETELVEYQTLYIESVPQLAMNSQWMFQKRQVAQQLIERLDLDRVIVQETIEAPSGPLGGLGGLGAGAGADIEDVASSIEDVDLEELEEEAAEDTEE